MILLTNIASFLINTLFNLYLIVILLRIVLPLSGVSFRNPILQFTYRMTNPLIAPFQQYIPKKYDIDWLAIILMFFIELLKLILLALLGILVVSVIGLIFVALFELVHIVLNFYFWVVLITAILSWLGPLHHSSLVDVLFLMTEPLLKPVRRILPPFAGFDLSPLVVLVLLKVLDIIVLSLY